MSEALSWFDKVWRSGLKPDSLLTVSEWADTHRTLSQISSPEPGRWKTSRTPYLKEIMDCLSVSSPVERVVFMKGAQIGGSEAGFNFLGYVIHHAPGPMLAVQPTVEGAKRNSRTRIEPMIEESAALRERVADPRARDSGNTIFQKSFPGGMLTLTGANSAVGLRSMPIRYLFLDEVDGYPGDADGEGDPVELAIKRTSTFVNRKILLVSTPTIKGTSRIEAAYNESDQRRYHVPCLACGEASEITWSTIKWDEGAPETAGFECPSCKYVHGEYEKRTLLERGSWVSLAEGDGRTAGFHLSALYSPWLSWAELAADFLKSRKDPARFQVFTNTGLGETWEDQGGEGLDAEPLKKRKETYGPELHPDIAIITAAMDMQGDRGEIEIVGWGAEEESWQLGYEVVYGDPTAPKFWLEIDKILKMTWPHSRAVPDLGISAMAIDSGGHYADSVFEYAHKRKRFPVWAIKGSSEPAAVVWPTFASKSNRNKRDLFIVGTNSAKHVIAQRMGIEEPGAGYCHLMADLDDIWFEQFTGSIVKTKYKHGKPIRTWQRRHDGDAIEAFDCRAYSYCALKGLERQRRMRLESEVERLRTYPLKSEGTSEIVARQAPAKRGRRRGR